MKPHEEEWEVYQGKSAEPDLQIYTDDMLPVATVRFCNSNALTAARARLAAQAPAMARVLLDIARWLKPALGEQRLPPDPERVAAVLREAGVIP